MSYFDSRVDECPFWQVVLIRVVKRVGTVDMVAFVAFTKIGQFGTKDWVDENNIEFMLIRLKYRKFGLFVNG